MLLSVAYFPPVEFFALLAENSTVYLEACEYYCKQSWRNRCRILTANGPMDLSVPVKHCGDLFHTPVSEVQVDYSVPWVRRTQYAIESAYFNSPFFIYYRDELFDILDSRPEKLWELDLELIRFFCRKEATAYFPTGDSTAGTGSFSVSVSALSLDCPLWTFFSMKARKAYAGSRIILDFQIFLLSLQCERDGRPERGFLFC